MNLRETRLWRRLSDLRYVSRNRGRRRFLAGFIKKGDLVFDVGANVGHFTLLALSLGARVVAVEPQSALAAKLRTRFSGSSSVRVVQCALGSSPGTATLHKTEDATEVASLRDDAAKVSRFGQDHSFSLSESVEVSTLADLFKSHGAPQFCKIDVEGYESAVLSGCSTAIPALSFEFCREYMPDTRRCLELLTALGRYQYNFAIGDEVRMAGSTWMTAEEIRKVLDADKDPLFWGDIYARGVPQAS
jgi:FkbM family methyltransferase